MVDKIASNTMIDVHEARMQTPASPNSFNPTINKHAKNRFPRLFRRLISSPILSKTAKIIPKFKTKSRPAYPQTIDKTIARAII